MIITKRYERENAVAYAKAWALSRNPLFENFAGIGGDCTNFVSQCLLAGSCTFDVAQPFGWYYESSVDRAPAWTSVELLHEFLVGAGDYPPNDSRSGPFGREVRMRSLQIGDIIQPERGGDYYHSLIVTGFERGDVLVSAHTDDALDRRLSTYSYDSVRFIHIDGVRLVLEQDDCFRALIDGIALP